MKYFAHKVKYKDLTFDSKAERDRYIYLHQQEQMGKISQLEMQKEFELLPKQYRTEIVHLKTKDKIVQKVDEQAVKYHCDFFYYDKQNELYIIEEIKSKMTAMIRDYPLRRKLVKLMVKRMNSELGRETYLFREIIK